MAYEYDQFGNVIGEYETEEERQARLKAEQEAAQAKVHKQEVITRADGTQTVKTETEVPAQAMPVAAPVAAEPVALGAPVAPARPPQARQPSRAELAQANVTGQRPAVPSTNDALFNNMVRAESGGRQFDAQGNILTSPKGAQGIAQIMPATAAAPGFGIKPATPEEIATPEGNQAFGLRYKEGMDRLFGGDPAKTAAAYNAGPGRVQQAEQMAAQRGGSWTDYIPKETRDYIQKTAGNVLNAVIPSAQAGTLPPQGAGAGRGTVGMPQAQPGEGVQVATGYGVQGTPGAPGTPAVPGQPRVEIDDNGIRTVTQADGTRQSFDQNGRPLLAGGQVPTNTEQYKTRLFLDAQNDPMKLAQIYQNKNEFGDVYSNLAGKQLSDLMSQKFKKDEATATVTTAIKNMGAGDMKSARFLADEMKKDEGSWVKMLLLGFISPDLAGAEAVKLGFGAQWQTQTLDDGTTALVKVRKDGKPMIGYDATTGAELSANQLAGVAGGKKELDIVGGTYVSDTLKDKNGNALVGRVVTDKKTGQSYIQTDQGRMSMAGFRPQSSTGSLADQRTRLIQELNLKLEGKTAEEKMAITRDYNSKLIASGYGPVQPYEVNLAAPQISGGTTTVGGGTTTTTGGAPVGGGTTTTTGGAPTSSSQGAPTSGTTAPVNAPPAGKRPTGPELDAERTKLTEEAEVTGKDIGTIRANFDKSKDAAVTLINQAQSLITDPGFSVSVGASAQPGFQFIPGTDKATFYAKHEEVVGKTFLAAIENLKGMGALSDREGQAATAAISRLKNLNQNEESFKAAVAELQDIVKRGVDRNAEKLGKPTVFGTKPFEEKTSGGEVDQDNPLLKKKKK